MDGDHVKKTTKEANGLKRRITNASDVLPTIGYDFLFKLIMEATGSFWKADLIFYGISGSFFVLYILLSKHLNKSS